MAVAKSKKPAAKKAAPPPDPSTYSKEQADEIAKTNKTWQDKVENPVDREEIEQLAKRICGDAKYVKDGMIFPCGAKKTGVYCVPAHASYPGGKSPLRTSKAAVDEINKTSKTNIDWNKIEAAEGGSHLHAYVPWMVGFTANKSGAAGVGNVYAPNIVIGGGRVKGASNSGVTVGSGVDLGAIKDTSELTKKGVSPALAEKLKPYLNKHKADACKALREKPLTLTEAEAEEINKFSENEHGKKAKSEYEKVRKNYNKAHPEQPMRSWDELSQGEQTALASREYHNGNILSEKPNGGLVNAIGTNDADAMRAAYASHRDGSAYRQRFDTEMRWMGVDPIPPKQSGGKK